MVFLEEFSIQIAESIKQIALLTSGGPNLTHWGPGQNTKTE